MKSPKTAAVSEAAPETAAADLPHPQSGGSYMRDDATGELVRIEAAEPPVEEGVKAPVETAEKEAN